MRVYDSRVLAEMSAEKYIWYPDIHVQAEMLKERQTLEESSPNVHVTIYSLEGIGHLEDFNHWKDALTNKTMVFKKAGFAFNDENIKSLSPIGYIVLIRD